MRLLTLNVIVAGLYALTGWTGLQFPYYGEHVTLLWAPAAIALAGLVLGGLAIVPGVFIGALAVNLTSASSSVGEGIAIAAGNTIGPALSSLLLVRAARFRPQLDRLRDALAYAGIGVLATSVLTATLGVLSLHTFGVLPRTDIVTAWSAWLGGDAVGLLIVGPAILTWLSTPDPALVKEVTRTEKTALGISVALFAVIVLTYGSRIPTLPYAFGPLFVWALLRLGPRGVALAVAFVTGGLMAGTAFGVGPFIAESATDGMIALWVFAAAVGSAGLAASALICERDRAVIDQGRLMRELDHRVKNTLATVIALAERSSDSATDMRDYLARFIGRLRGIARTHEGMARSDWHPMKLTDVVALTLAPFDEAAAIALSTNGGQAMIGTAQVTPLTMLLHELATNAAKHGAWSRPEGRVAIAWERAANGDLVFSWSESGGPAVAHPASRGYGLRLIEGLASHELGGRAEFEFTERGFVCRLQIPLPH